MALAALRFWSLSRRSTVAFLRCSLAHSSPSQRSLEESVLSAVEANRYQQLPELLDSSKEFGRNPNPFAFLSRFTESHRLHVVDGILQSLICVRPRERSRGVYNFLLSYALESSTPIPLALAILQRMLRSGHRPVSQTHLLLSNAWIERLQKLRSVSSVLSEMHSIGYSPDSGTCNYLIMSLCKVDRLEEAIKVLRGMSKGGCIPDLDSYGVLIGGMSELRMTTEVLEMVKEMVKKHGMNPRQDTMVKAFGAMRANRDIWRSVEMIEFLEGEDVYIGFEAYESVLEGCLEGHHFVLAGKLVIKMTERGLIPYIKERQRVYEGLVGVGELELANIVRKKFAELKS
ncbi:pentatricopeptide repeat-containing protein-like [Dorcoceras hygrometricum]|uniref:Pentatricopeptide repeat-containing protein-like n=1 Tax=Dorcoceras hygrometricum TaxID=472368 RepID=A0A2Z7D745_9LAMI|nr:pentatricopeptide repeat-containing protein-like [Dorcoceras hygrometricum]